MNPQKRKYFIIIVHFGARAATDRALASIYSDTLTHKQVVVIDHAKKPYQTAQPAKVIRPQHNRGYAAGINTGLGALISLGATQQDAVICMNNDIALQTNTLTNLAGWWEKHNPDNALVNLTIREKGQLIAGSQVNLITGKTILQTPHKRKAGFYLLPAVHGACFASTLATLAKLKGMPEQYFMYWEDVALSLRAQMAGVQITHAQGVQVDHLENKTVRQTENQLYYLVRNGAIVLATKTPLPWRLHWKARNYIRALAHTLIPRKPIIQEALWDAIKKRTGIRPAQSV